MILNQTDIVKILILHGAATDCSGFPCALEYLELDSVEELRKWIKSLIDNEVLSDPMLCLMRALLRPLPCPPRRMMRLGPRMLGARKQLLLWPPKYCDGSSVANAFVASEIL